ncbi:MAG TPA: response regulator [Candidatus Obscuribacterales bacterium]
MMKKILVIEDEKTILRNILELLQEEDFEVISSDNGADGIQMAKEQVPDLILCDVMMPGLDGYEVLKQVRQYPLTATIPFIFLTALSDKAHLRQGMELGADDYLTKPCMPDELLRAIATRLEKQAAIHKQSEQKMHELRSSISSSLPHEFKTPLSGILLLSDLMLLEIDCLQPSKMRKMLERIQIYVKKIDRLVENFFLATKLQLIYKDSEQVNALQSCRTDSAKIIIAQAIEKARQFQREADLQLELEDANIKMAESDFIKIIQELLDNACKFSHARTPIKITSRVEDNTFVLDVSNKGRGMSAEQIASIGAYIQFERKLYEQQGSGLGLVITKRLAELYAGKLAIESIPGQQTTVRVNLPAVLNS